MTTPTTLSRTRSVSESSSSACKSLAGAPNVTNVIASETGLWRAYHTPQSDAEAVADSEALEALQQTTGLQLETQAAALNNSEAQSRRTVRVSSSSGQQLSRTQHPEGPTTTNNCTQNEAERENETAPHVSQLVVPFAVSRTLRTTNSHGTTAAMTTGASSSAATAEARQCNCWLCCYCRGSSCSIV